MLEKEFPEVMLLRGDGNLWWTKAVNLGIKKVQTSFKEEDCILISNNDIVINDDYLSNIVQYASKNANSIIGSTTLDVNSGKILNSGIKRDFLGSLYVNKGRFPFSNRPELVEADGLIGRGMLIPVGVFNKIGLFNELLPHYGADIEFSMRAKKYGYKLLVSSKAVVYTDLSQRERHVLGMANPLKYVKWLFSIKNPSNFYSQYFIIKKYSRFWILGFFYDFIKKVAVYFRNLFIYIIRYKKKEYK